MFHHHHHLIKNTDSVNVSQTALLLLNKSLKPQYKHHTIICPLWLCDESHTPLTIYNNDFYTSQSSVIFGLVPNYKAYKPYKPYCTCLNIISPFWMCPKPHTTNTIHSIGYVMACLKLHTLVKHKGFTITTSLNLQGTQNIIVVPACHCLDTI